ncbi:MAG: sigma-70 family RNA polymerase sigma factor [Syntrophobacterales bacterium]|nr:MAG: sigma-70 family RNA polymerase sigma factor [Syntrophobacterales bacterium]
MRYTHIMDRSGVFYRAHKNKLFSYLMRLTGDYHLSSDITQETFARYLNRYRGEQNVPLLYRIAKNALLDCIRKRKRETLLEEDHPDRSANQEQAATIREEYRRVISAMEELRDDEREVLSLVLSGELSYQEIAELTGTSEANIKVKVHRARRTLKNILGEKKYE